MIDMTIHNTLDALTRVLDLFCYERGLGLSTIDTVLANPSLSLHDREWLETFSKLLRLTRAVEIGVSADLAAGTPTRVECELIDYRHVSPYRVYIGQGSTPPDEYNGYHAALYCARAESVAKGVPVWIHDGCNVRFWEIRILQLDIPNMDGPICTSSPT